MSFSTFVAWDATSGLPSKSNSLSPSKQQKSDSTWPIAPDHNGNLQFFFAKLMLTIASVPVFDGRQPFNFDKYEKAPAYSEDIAVGAAVMVVFCDKCTDARTVKGKQAPTYRHDIKAYVLGVVLLADAFDADADADEETDESATEPEEVYTSSLVI